MLLLFIPFKSMHWPPKWTLLRRKGVCVCFLAISVTLMSTGITLENLPLTLVCFLLQYRWVKSKSAATLQTMAETATCKLQGLTHRDSRTPSIPALVFAYIYATLASFRRYTNGFGGWSDAVYMQKRSCGASNAQIILANDMGGYVHVIDTSLQQLVSSIVIGPLTRPVHSYAIPPLSQFWSHADGSGTFEVINIEENLSGLAHAQVTAHVDDPGHGKLLWDPDLLPLAYASNTAEGFVYEINLSATPPAITQTLNTTWNGMTCSGTHGMAYSSVNHHVYATCSGPAGTFGLAEIDPTAWTVVQIITGFNGGQAYESADGEYVVDIDKGNSLIHVVSPGANGVASTRAFPSVPCSGNPDKVAFFQYSDSTGNIQDRIFFSLTSPQSQDGTGGGVAWIDTAELEADAFGGATCNHVEAGNVKRGGFSTHRSILRAGRHIVVPTDYPPTYQNASSPWMGQAAVSLVNASFPSHVMYAYVNDGPSRVAWAPDSCTATPATPPAWDVEYTASPASAWLLHQAADFAALRTDLQAARTAMDAQNTTIANLRGHVADIMETLNSINHACINDTDHRRRRRDSHGGCPISTEETPSTSENSTMNTSAIVAVAVTLAAVGLAVVALVLVKANSENRATTKPAQTDNMAWDANACEANDGAYLEVDGHE